MGTGVGGTGVGGAGVGAGVGLGVGCGVGAGVGCFVAGLQNKHISSTTQCANKLQRMLFTISAPATGDDTA